MGHVDDPSGAAEHGELPVACTLGASDGPARLHRWQHLHQIAAPTAQLTSGELEVRYQPGPEVLAELQDLVDEERVCCAFVSWAVTEDSGQPVLRVTASPLHRAHLKTSSPSPPCSRPRTEAERRPRRRSTTRCSPWRRRCLVLIHTVVRLLESLSWRC